MILWSLMMRYDLRWMKNQLFDFSFFSFLRWGDLTISIHHKKWKISQDQKINFVRFQWNFFLVWIRPEKNKGKKCWSWEKKNSIKRCSKFFFCLHFFYGLLPPYSRDGRCPGAPHCSPPPRHWHPWLWKPPVSPAFSPSPEKKFEKWIFHP